MIHGNITGAKTERIQSAASTEQDDVANRDSRGYWAIAYFTRESLSDRWILMAAITGAVFLGISFPIVSQIGSGARFWRWMDLRLRPQVFTAVMLLGVIAAIVVFIDQAANEIAAGAVGGIVALAKDIINTEDEPSNPSGGST